MAKSTKAPRRLEDCPAYGEALKRERGLDAEYDRLLAESKDLESKLDTPAKPDARINEEAEALASGAADLAVMMAERRTAQEKRRELAARLNAVNEEIAVVKKAGALARERLGDAEAAALEEITATWRKDHEPHVMALSAAMSDFERLLEAEAAFRKSAREQAGTSSLHLIADDLRGRCTAFVESVRRSDYGDLPKREPLPYRPPFVDPYAPR